MNKVINISNNKAPIFTQEQVDYLDKTFPELEMYTNEPNELYVNLGKRSVVKHLARLVSSYKQRGT